MSVRVAVGALQEADAYAVRDGFGACLVAISDRLTVGQRFATTSFLAGWLVDAEPQSSYRLHVGAVTATTPAMADDERALIDLMDAPRLTDGQVEQLLTLLLPEPS